MKFFFNYKTNFDLIRVILRLLKKERKESITSLMLLNFSRKSSFFLFRQRVQMIVSGDLQNFQHNELCWGQSLVWEEKQIH